MYIAKVTVIILCFFVSNTNRCTIHHLKACCGLWIVWVTQMNIMRKEVIEWNYLINIPVRLKYNATNLHYLARTRIWFWCCHQLELWCWFLHLQVSLQLFYTYMNITRNKGTLKDTAFFEREYLGWTWTNMCPGQSLVSHIVGWKHWGHLDILSRIGDHDSRVQWKSSGRGHPSKYYFGLSCLTSQFKYDLV